MIILSPDSSLREKSFKVKAVDSQLKKVLRDLFENLKASKIGVGLSAPQVGSRLRVFIASFPKECSCAKGESCSCQSGVDCFINPEIVDTFSQKKDWPMISGKGGRKENFLEGCLSFPGVYGTVKRWLRIKVRYQTISKENSFLAREEILEGFPAIVFQHELDHLDGILFVDRIEEDCGKIFLEKEGKLEERSLNDFSF